VYANEVIMIAIITIMGMAANMLPPIGAYTEMKPQLAVLCSSPIMYNFSYYVIDLISGCVNNLIRHSRN